MSEALGAYDVELMDGQVDLFGLDEFGAPAGMNATWGAIIGGGMSTGTAIAVRNLTKPKAAGASGFDWQKHSEGIGFIVGGLTSGLMMVFPGTRAAGWAGLATAFVTSGLREIEAMFTGTSLKAAVIEKLNGVVMEPLKPTQMRGFGVADIERVPPAYGTIPGVYGTGAIQGPGMAGTHMGEAPPIDLLQQAALPENAAHVQLVGGPAMSGLGTHYGATLFGGE